MPKIEAYFGHGAIVPVDSAVKRTAYLSPFNGAVFGTKKGYVDHLKQARIQIHQNVHKINKKKIMQTLWDQPSFEDVIGWLESHQEFLFNNGLERNEWRLSKTQKGKTVFDPSTFKATISYLSLSWKDKCSNSHRAPHNGRTNWAGKDVFKDGTPVPNGYPGWTGRIEYMVESKFDLGGSDVFDNLRIHTGTGGSGNGVNYGYDVTFFDADWPGMRDSYGKQFAMEATMDLISDRTPQKHSFLYGTPRYFGRTPR